MTLSFAGLVLTSFIAFGSSAKNTETPYFFSDPEEKKRDLDSVLNYSPMPGIYHVELNYYKYPLDTLKAYLELHGVQFIENSPFCARIENLQTAIKLEKKFLNSKYAIKIYPVRTYKPFTMEGWGGSCRYYLNRFEIYFNAETQPDWIESKLQESGITNFSNSTYEEQISYEVTFKSAIDRSCMSSLKKIWALDEVRFIHQMTGSVAGLD